MLSITDSIKFRKFPQRRRVVEDYNSPPAFFCMIVQKMRVNFCAAICRSVRPHTRPKAVDFWVRDLAMMIQTTDQPLHASHFPHIALALHVPTKRTSPSYHSQGQNFYFIMQLSQRLMSFYIQVLAATFFNKFIVDAAGQKWKWP